MKVAFKVLVAMLFIVYPLVVFYGLNYFEPKVLALLLGGMLLLRVITVVKVDKNKLDISGKRQALIIALIGMGVVAYTMLSNTVTGLKFYPAIISFSFLFAFSYSLYNPPSVIERIARISEPDLTEAGVIYTTTVTKIWCAFFILNGVISLYTSLFASFEIWTLYNGLVSYLLMGMLFIGEYMYRYFFLTKSIK